MSACSLDPLGPHSEYPAATKPTMYFIGVTTHQSSIMHVFPHWAELLGLGDVLLRGINFRQHDEPAHYRRAVEFIKHDPLSLGALVTTHKLDLLRACDDLIDQRDEFARLTDEVSCLNKQDGKFCGHAVDPITSGLAVNAILPDNYWSDTGAEAFICGAGGSAVAFSWYLLQPQHGRNRPSRVIISNRSRPRLDDIQRFHQAIGADIPIEYHLTPAANDSDAIVASLKPGSLIANATGLGKDAPGSPLSDDADWPENGIAWDFNYRGDLVFLQQAARQQHDKHLRIEDGWVYFLHGWGQVIAKVFHVDVPSSGEHFDKLSAIATRYRHG